MLETRRSRGRPKGSGIDDTVILTQVSALLSKQPDLKPTTAIRQLGISNESTIRRLRDKWRQTASGQSHTRTLAKPVTQPRQLMCATNPAYKRADTHASLQPTTAAASPPPEEPEKRGQLQRQAPEERNQRGRTAAVDLGLSMMAATIATANLIAVQQVILWNAGLSAVAQQANCRRTAS